MACWREAEYKLVIKNLPGFGKRRALRQLVGMLG